MSLASTRSDGRSIPILASSARAFFLCSFSAQDTSLTRYLLTAELHRERVIGCKQTAPVSRPSRSGVGLENAFLAFSPFNVSQLSDMRSSSTLSLSRNGPSKCVPSSCNLGCCCCSFVPSLTSLRTLPPPASRQQMLGGSDDAYVREVSFVDPINQKMTMFSVNLSLSREWAPSARERV